MAPRGLFWSQPWAAFQWSYAQALRPLEALGIEGYWCLSWKGCGSGSQWHRVGYKLSALRWAKVTFFPA